MSQCVNSQSVATPVMRVMPVTHRIADGAVLYVSSRGA